VKSWFRVQKPPLNKKRASFSRDSYFKTAEKRWLFCFSRDPAGIRTLSENQRLNSIWNGFAFLLTESLTIFMYVLAAIAIV
jgi:hypothetical protein